MAMTIKIIPNVTGNPPGKLADAELHFDDGPLAGLKLIGFGVWERRDSARTRTVTFPARQYTINGERRSFALLRAIGDLSALDGMRARIVEAYDAYEQRDQSTAIQETPRQTSQQAPRPAEPRPVEPMRATQPTQPTRTSTAPSADDIGF